MAKQTKTLLRKSRKEWRENLNRVDVRMLQIASQLLILALPIVIAQRILSPLIPSQDLLLAAAIAAGSTINSFVVPVAKAFIPTTFEMINQITTGAFIKNYDTFSSALKMNLIILAGFIALVFLTKPVDNQAKE